MAGFNMDKFWPRVEKGECWIWVGGRTGDGYGQVYSRRGMPVLYAHRVAYEELVAEIPVGYEIDHLCRNRRCVRPDHLEAVTPAENRRRQIHHNRMKTHCPNGHPYSGENLRVVLDARGHVNRSCRACRSEQDRIRYLRKRAA